MTNEGEIISRQVVERVVRKCPLCEGTGMAYLPECATCHERFTAEQIDALFAGAPTGEPHDTVTLPCGHTARPNFIEEQDCPSCGGTGLVTTERDVTAFMDQILKAGADALGCLASVAVFDAAMRDVSGQLEGEIAALVERLGRGEVGQEVESCS